MKFENSANRPTASHRQHRPIPFWVKYSDYASNLPVFWRPYHGIWNFGQSADPPAIGNIGQFHFESNIWIMRRIYLLFDAHIMEFENSADGRPAGHLPMGRLHGGVSLIDYWLEFMNLGFVLTSYLTYFTHVIKKFEIPAKRPPAYGPTTWPIYMAGLAESFLTLSQCRSYHFSVT